MISGRKPSRTNTRMRRARPEGCAVATAGSTTGLSVCAVDIMAWSLTTFSPAPVSTGYYSLTQEHCTSVEYEHLGRVFHPRSGNARRAEPRSEHVRTTFAPTTGHTSPLIWG